MYSQIIISIFRSDNDTEAYEYIFNTSNYTYFNFKNSLTLQEHDLYSMELHPRLNIDDITYDKTDFNISFCINKYIGDEIRFLKNSTNFVYGLNIIKYKVDDNTYKIIGVEYNGNVYYLYNNSCDINKYDSFTETIVDKSYISEIVIESFKYYLRFKCKFNHSTTLLDSYDKFYKKKYITCNYANSLSYMNLYQSVMLKFEIYGTDEKTSYTFLPVNKNSRSNLFYIYQSVFDVLESKGNLKTFNNPKNEQYFGEDNRIIDTNYKLRVRLYVSKHNNCDTLYYRKATEKNDYNIKMILSKRHDKIIGFVFHCTKYFIWKNNGDLSFYETYSADKKYKDLIANAFKDALGFLFKIY